MLRNIRLHFLLKITKIINCRTKNNTITRKQAWRERKRRRWLIIKAS